ncbi:MAG: HAD-IC family P-type ATPase [Firmicutes bacterium]|nr:HAD-IC family P-type ATPase [Bacillota bacterium]
MTNWFNLDVADTIKELDSDKESGLTTEEVQKRQTEYGLNELKAKKKKSIIIKFLEQFKDFMIIVLIISAIVSGIIGVINGEGIADTIIILIVVIVNAIVGVMQENKAEKSLEALQKLSSHVAKVIRNGKLEVLPSRELVPGDIVIIETGDYIPADLRIIEAINLKSQESALTGESVPVEKEVGRIDNEKIGIGDRINMLFSSSLVTYGRGKAVVVETGMNTEVGKIANMINSSISTATPLQKKLNQLGKTLGIGALIICAVIFGVGLAYGKEVLQMFMTAVSLAVAAIPEGLPAVFTIVLAIGVQRMVKRNAIVKKLPAVETLGSATVICSDKTGTLTQNKMTVEKLYYNGKIVGVDAHIDPILQQLIYTCMLCNDTKIAEDKTLTGDPTETALVDLGLKLDFEPAIYGEFPRIDEIPFDSDRKLMTTVHEAGDKYIVYTKGGVDELLNKCTHIMGDVGADSISARAHMECAPTIQRPRKDKTI